MTRAALYARVSTKEQGDYGTSLETQIKRMREYCAQHGYTVAIEEQEDYSGRTDNRPKINKIKEAAKNGEIDAILTYSRDRYARSRLAGMMLDLLFRDAGITRLYVMREESTDTPQGHLRDGFDDLLHEYEIENMVERTLRAKRQRAEDGYISNIGRHIKFGYKKVTRDGAADLAIDDTVHYVIPHRETNADVVRWIFHYFVHENWGATRLADDLIANDIRTLNGQTFTIFTIYKILRSEEYKGVFYANKHIKTTMRDGKVVNKKKDKSEWMLIAREDLRLVDDATWEAAQRNLDSGRGFVAKYDYLFSRRVMCMHNHRMICRPSTKDDVTRYYYMCNKGKFIRKKCDMPYFSSTLVDAKVFAWISELICDPEAVLVGMQKRQQQKLANNREAIEYIAACDKLIAQHEEELQYLIEEAKQFKDKPRIREQYRRQIAECSTQLDLLETQRRQHEEHINQSVISDEEIAHRVNEVKKLNAFLSQLGTLEFKARRKLVELLNIEIVLGVEGGRRYIDVYWYGIPGTDEPEDRLYLEDVDELPNQIWYSSVQRVGAARTGVYSNLVPVAAVIAAWLVRGEQIVPLQGLGAVAIVTGLWLTRWGRAPRGAG